MSQQHRPSGESRADGDEGPHGAERERRGDDEPLRDDEPAIAEALDELGGSGEVTPGDDNAPELGRGRASEPGRPLRSP